MSAKKVWGFGFVAMFATPWLHRLSYENLMHAIPMDPSTAHGFAIGMALAVMAIGLLVISAP